MTSSAEHVLLAEWGVYMCVHACVRASKVYRHPARALHLLSHQVVREFNSMSCRCLYHCATKKIPFVNNPFLCVFHSGTFEQGWIAERFAWMIASSSSSSV